MLLMVPRIALPEPNFYGAGSEDFGRLRLLLLPRSPPPPTFTLLKTIEISHNTVVVILYMCWKSEMFLLYRLLPGYGSAL